MSEQFAELFWFQRPQLLLWIYKMAYFRKCWPQSACGMIFLTTWQLQLAVVSHQFNCPTPSMLLDARS
jgi:hypothetical protein